MSAEALPRPPAPAPAPGGRERGGVLVVDKPRGVTSHDVVDVVRRRFRERAIGHLGTLDPGASGLLALAIGPATRCVPVWQGGEKTYEAVIRLGVVTDTQDTSGEVLETREVAVTPEDLRAASRAFEGDQLQVPPMVSAIRVRGERLYRLARRGITVERTPRPIHVAEWRWTGFALPSASCVIRCSGGTYVRTLAHDLGARLGCGAALESLRRVRSAPFDLALSIDVRGLHELTPDAAWERAGIPLDRALDVLPDVTLDAAEATALGYGAAVALAPDRATDLPLDAGPRSIVLRDAAGHALALGDVVAGADGARLVRPHVVFPWAARQGRA